MDHIRQTFPRIRYAVGVRDMRTSLFSRGGGELDLQVLATEPDYVHITRSGISRGRFLSDLDASERKRVCVVGHEAARSLFSWHDPLEETVRIGQDWYRVVGVLDNRASLKAAGGEDINRCVFIPLATAAALYGDTTFKHSAGVREIVRVQLDAIALQLEGEDAVLPIADRLRVYLAKTHKQQDYTMQVPLDLKRQKEAEAETYAIVMGSIAGIALIVGGIGIMNIMLANVYDRRKEIGTRRALGARRRDILYQFLFEASTLTSMGGLFGAALGYALTGYHCPWWGGRTVITHVTGGWPAVFTLWSAALGVGVSCFVGILFGLWPARQAAKVSPIEALRSE
jgi:putative ABC transport system permease protein